MSKRNPRRTPEERIAARNARIERGRTVRPPKVTRAEQRVMDEIIRSYADWSRSR